LHSSPTAITRCASKPVQRWN